MSDEWYYHRDGHQYGPVSFSELSSLCAQAQLAPTDMVWQSGTPNWVAADTIPGLTFPADAAHVDLLAPLDDVPGASVGELIRIHFQRAFAWNMAGLPITENEERALTELGITSPRARDYLCWRKSLLWVIAFPTLLAAVLYVIHLLSKEVELTVFGTLILILDIVAHFALPAAVVLGACFWMRPRLSTRIVTWTWLAAFLFPMFQALLPLEWLIDLSELEENAQGEAARVGIGIFAGFVYYLNLMPIVLSVIPGIIRACLRIKMLLPNSMLSGWFLIGATPLYGLLFLVTFIMFNQMVGNAVLLLSMVFFLGAPLIYLTRISLFTSPITSSEQSKTIQQLQIVQLIAVLVGLILLLIYLFTKEFLGKKLAGFSSDDSLIQIWDLLRFGAEILGRSLFITVVAAHFLLKATITAYEGEQLVRENVDADDYERSLEQIGSQLDLGGNNVTTQNAEGYPPIEN